MALKISALERNNTDEFDGFYAIYSTAFPLSEQKPRDALLAMQHASFYTIYLAHNDEKIVGFCIMKIFSCLNTWQLMRHKEA